MIINRLSHGVAQRHLGIEVVTLGYPASKQPMTLLMGCSCAVAPLPCAKLRPVGGATADVFFILLKLMMASCSPLKAVSTAIRPRHLSSSTFGFQSRTVLPGFGKEGVQQAACKIGVGRFQEIPGVSLSAPNVAVSARRGNMLV